MFEKYNTMSRNGNGWIRSIIAIAASYAVFAYMVAEKL